jgi:hypothetical protein
MLLLAVAVEACTGGTNSPITNPTIGTSQTTFTLGSSTVIQGFTSGGVTGSIIYPTGSGSVTGSIATSPPSGIAALSSVLRASGTGAQTTSGTRVVAAASPSPSPAPNVPLIYVTYSGTATLSGLPGISITLPSGAAAGTVYYEAEWNATQSQWVTVGGAGSSSGTTVTFNGGATPIALSASAPIYVAVYSGAKISLATPTPTPTPVPTATPTPGASPTATPVYADGGFESNSIGALGSTIGSNGWTQCNVQAVASGITYTGGISGTGAYSAATAPPASTYSPSPGTTPAAVIVSNGSSAPAGTHSPTPTQVTAPSDAGSYVAQFGQLFNTYNAGNYYYNGLCQTVTVADPNGASLSAYVFESGNEASTYVEDLIGTVTQTNTPATTTPSIPYTLTLQNILYMENIETSTVTTDSAYRKIGPITIPTGTTTLFLGMWTKAGSSSGSMNYSSYWWVDGLSIVNK